MILIAFVYFLMSLAAEARPKVGVFELSTDKLCEIVFK